MWRRPPGPKHLLPEFESESPTPTRRFWLLLSPSTTCPTSTVNQILCFSRRLILKTLLIPDLSFFLFHFVVFRCFVACADSCRHLGSWSDWSKCIPHDCSTPAAKGTLTAAAASKPTLPAHLPGNLVTLMNGPANFSAAEESRTCQKHV